MKTKKCIERCWQMEEEAENRVMLQQIREALGLLEAGRRREESVPRGSEGALWPCQLCDFGPLASGL